MKLFFAPEIPNVPHNILYGSYMGTWATQYASNLFQSFPTDAVKALITAVTDPKEADYILVPHNYGKIAKRSEYIKTCEELSRESGKQLMVVAYGDSHAPVAFSNAIVFRTSQYRNLKKENEIIMPAYIEDIGGGSVPRQKSGIPTVGFVGRGRAMDVVREIRDRCTSFFVFPFRKQFPCAVSRLMPGLSVREKAMDMFVGKTDVVTRFIVRKTYSGNTHSIELDPHTARKEYIDTIRESDLTLSPKGEGNYSLRFFETLAASRVPLLIDTCMELPLEHVVKYDECTVRVPFSSIATLHDQVVEWWKGISEGEYVQMQQNARKAFTEYLRIDKFFEHVFMGLLQK